MIRIIAAAHHTSTAIHGPNHHAIDPLNIRMKIQPHPAHSSARHQQEAKDAQEQDFYDSGYFHMRRFATG